MDKTKLINLLSPQIKAKISEIGSEVTSKDLESYGKLKEIEDRSFRLRKIIDAWEKQHTEERNMRKGFAKAILFALFIQIVSINIAFFLIGFNKIHVEQWVANTFIIAVFTEISAMVFAIVKYLFPEKGNEILQLLVKL